MGKKNKRNFKNAKLFKKEQEKARPKIPPPKSKKTRILMLADSCGNMVGPPKFLKKNDNQWARHNYCLRSLKGGSLRQNPVDKNGFYQIQNNQNDLADFHVFILWLGQG